MKTFKTWIQENYFPKPSQMGNASFQIKNLAQTLQVKNNDQISIDDINKLKQTYSQLLKSIPPQELPKYQKELVNIKNQILSLKPQTPNIDPRVDHETFQNAQSQKKQYHNLNKLS